MPVDGNINSIKHFILDHLYTFKGLEEAAELMVKQQFTGLLGPELWVLGSLTVHLMLWDFPNFVQESFQAQSLLY